MIETSLNRLEFNLKQQYQHRIENLQNQISEQLREIIKLQEELKYMSKDRYYDC